MKGRTLQKKVLRLHFHVGSVEGPLFQPPSPSAFERAPTPINLYLTCAAVAALSCCSVTLHGMGSRETRRNRSRCTEDTRWRMYADRQWVGDAEACVLGVGGGSKGRLGAGSDRGPGQAGQEGCGLRETRMPVFKSNPDRCCGLLCSCKFVARLMVVGESPCTLSSCALHYAPRHWSWGSGAVVGWVKRRCRGMGRRQTPDEVIFGSLKPTVALDYHTTGNRPEAFLSLFCWHSQKRLGVCAAWLWPSP